MRIKNDEEYQQCDAKDCYNLIDVSLVIHHHDDNDDCDIDEEDNNHCVFKLCNAHADMIDKTQKEGDRTGITQPSPFELKNEHIHH